MFVGRHTSVIQILNDLILGTTRAYSINQTTVFNGDVSVVSAKTMANRNSTALYRSLTLLNKKTEKFHWEELHVGRVGLLWWSRASIAVLFLLWHMRLTGVLCNKWHFSVFLFSKYANTTVFYSLCHDIKIVFNWTWRFARIDVITFAGVGKSTAIINKCGKKWYGDFWWWVIGLILVYWASLAEGPKTIVKPTRYQLHEMK